MTSNTATPLFKQFKEVHGRKLAYVDVGTGRPLVLLHGNPTSSYLWRNVIPHLVSTGRVIVPDLLGHGDSEKIPAHEGPGRYSFEATYHYLDGLLSALGVTSEVTLVLHDWGSALGFHWAHKHPDAIRGIAYMEALVMPFPTWNDWPEKARNMFKGFRSEKGEDMILNRNLFIEAVLQASIIRKLTDAEMDAYRAPFTDKENRQVTLNWPRQLPIAGETASMVAIVEEYSNWLKNCDIPKLFINGDPGSILIGKQREFCRSWKNQKEVSVKGLHFIQEDSPDLIGDFLAKWVVTIP